jgi:hypothetical protein
MAGVECALRSPMTGTLPRAIDWLCRSWSLVKAFMPRAVSLSLAVELSAFDGKTTTPGSTRPDFAGEGTRIHMGGPETPNQPAPGISVEVTTRPIRDGYPEARVHDGETAGP